jgi:hypothetical protein
MMGRIQSGRLGGGRLGWAAIVLPLAASACSLSDYYANSDHYPRGFGDGQIMFTTAEQRSLTSTQAHLDEFGRNRPSRIGCVEPSPDVAKAIATSMNTGISVSIEGSAADLPAQAKADIAGAVARARSEALAQLTERVPTIQLLRDGLFRACEAYSNGALSSMSYALMLSRYGDAMVTLLGQDLAAGDFGRQLAALSTTAGGNANSSLNRSSEETRSLYNKVSEDISTLRETSADLGKAEQAAASAQTAEERQHAEDKVSRLREQRDDLSRKLSATLSAAASAATSATATPGAALVAQNISNERAATIAKMQSDFMGNPSPAALLVACVTALDRTSASDLTGSADDARRTEAIWGPRDRREPYTALAELCAGRHPTTMASAASGNGAASQMMYGSSPASSADAAAAQPGLLQQVVAMNNKLIDARLAEATGKPKPPADLSAEAAGVVQKRVGEVTAIKAQILTAPAPSDKPADPDEKAFALVETNIAHTADISRALQTVYAPGAGPAPKANDKACSPDLVVYRVQARLIALGYDIGAAKPDCAKGNKTTAAIKLFQQKSHLDASGELDEKTVGAVLAASPA